MCIFVATTSHREFPLVILDNRDEVFERPTAPAHWWSENNSIYSPQDLARRERGTWIGVSRNGRACVLVNFFEEDPSLVASVISRGALPKQFLESSLSPTDWVNDIKRKHSDELISCGGFTLLVAMVVPPTDGKPSPSTELAFLTNRDTNIPNTGLQSPFSMSNGPIGDPTWTKTVKAVEMFAELQNETDPLKLTSKGISLLSTATKDPLQSRFELRNHVFVPQVDLDTEGGHYGTRTQTAIVVDRSCNVYYTEVDVVSGQTKTEKFSICT